MLPDILSDRNLKLDDPALEPDHGGVCAVLRAKLGKDVSDLTFYRGLADGEVLGRQSFDRAVRQSTRATFTRISSR